MSEQTQNVVDGWILFLGPQGVAEVLQNLKLLKDGSTLQRIARIDKWLLGSYEPSDFVVLPDQDKGQDEERKISKHTNRKCEHGEKSGGTTPALTKQHALQGWLESDEVVQ